MKEFKQKPLKGLEDLNDKKYSIDTLARVDSINQNRTKESCSKGGKIGKGGQKAKELKLGFHSFTKEERSEIGKKVGAIIGPRSYKEGFGMYGLSDERKKEIAIDGGKKSAKSPKHPNNVKVICEHCSFETSLPLYKRWHGNNCKHKNERI